MVGFRSDGECPLKELIELPVGLSLPDWYQPVVGKVELDRGGMCS
jgi:hypothetical protein